MMIKQILKSIFNTFGFQINRKDSKFRFLGYDFEEEANDAIKIVRSFTMLPRERLITLFQKTIYCENHGIQGSFVECGVWKGGAVGLMALANLKHGKVRRHIHLFDSFQEICEPDRSVDGEKAIEEVKRRSEKGGLFGRLRPLPGFYDAIGGPGTVAESKMLIEQKIGYPPEYLHYHQGWFQDTLPRDAHEIQEVAILRLDGDWFASTKICLEFLYDKVTLGGFIIIDDYGAYAGCKKAVDEFRQSRLIASYLHHIDEVGRYWIKS